MMDIYTRQWITENALDEIPNYDKGVLTLRALHYRLVARGMTNTIQHYKRVVAAMVKARWDDQVSFDTFSDHDRSTLGETEYSETRLTDEIESSKGTIEFWMDHYSKNRWENQDTYIEVWIEKKALQGIFEPICNKFGVILAPCKGYPSLTFVNQAKLRFEEAQKTHETKILYFGDYDPSGEDIPRSIKDNLIRLGVSVEVDRRLLLEHQVVAWNLPPAPVKQTDSRTATWDGLGQVELDAVEPNQLKNYIEEAIIENIDADKLHELREQEAIERVEYRQHLKEFVQTL